MSRYANRIPLSDPAACADWLVSGLERFNLSMRRDHVGVPDAFPGYTFSVATDIPSQFSDLFAALDADERRCMREGIREALLRFELSRGFWYGTCIDIIRLALNFHPKLITQSAPALLRMCREAVANNAKRQDAESLYANVIAAIGAQERFNSTVINLIEQELPYAREIFPQVLPLLCRTIAASKPSRWTEQLLTAASAVWPDNVKAGDADKDAFEHLVKKFASIAKPGHLAAHLQQLYLGFRAADSKLHLFMAALFRSKNTAVLIDRNTKIHERDVPYVVASVLSGSSFPVKFHRLAGLERNQFDAYLSTFVDGSLENSLQTIDAIAA